MQGWWVASAWAVSPVYFFSWVIWVIGSITLHELAHGWAAIRCGDRTPIELGRMTPNPLVHMGGFSLIVFGLIGIAWGVMPVDPSRFRGRYDAARVAFAGPAMNLSLALGACVVLAVLDKLASGSGSDLVANLRAFFFVGALLNVVLAMFNLLPVPPLDGSRILADFSTGYARIWQGEHAQTIALIAFLAVFWFLADPLFHVAGAVVDVALRVLRF